MAPRYDPGIPASQRQAMARMKHQKTHPAARPQPGRCIVMRITCHEPSDVLRVQDATRGLSCHVGLEGC